MARGPLAGQRTGRSRSGNPRPIAKNEPVSHSQNTPPPLCYPRASPPHAWFLAGCSSPFTRLAGHPHVSLCAWCEQSMSAWSVKTRRAPSRHCRDARVYGYTTTAMHDISAPPATHSPPQPQARDITHTGMHASTRFEQASERARER